MTGPEVPTAMREAHLQTMFDVLTERARVAWALKQRVRPRQHTQTCACHSDEC